MQHIVSSFVHVKHGLRFKHTRESERESELERRCAASSRACTSALLSSPLCQLSSRLSRFMLAYLCPLCEGLRPCVKRISRSCTRPRPLAHHGGVIYPHARRHAQTNPPDTHTHLHASFVRSHGGTGPAVGARRTGQASGPRLGCVCSAGRGPARGLRLAAYDLWR
jgi:hypothetical protein